ncbi:exosortase/archaeosortase family protein [Geomonas oryzae]|uniref:exosortase/archaeosortase family protein n=1 Tax=Geomonas oryzae TaxID=2364273 RepID=UPI0013A5C4B8|nr:exosortase/archaeosortase family protein [Geomonas oryzae]
MDAAVCEKNTKPEAGMLFILLVAASVAVTSLLPPAFFTLWRELAIKGASLMGALTGMTVTSGGDILTVNGFPMRIIHECTAFNYVLILSTAILFYPRHTLQYRLAGVLVAAPLVVILNALRLVISGFAGTVSMNLFNFVHEYLWVALFSLLIFGIWKVWVDKRLVLKKTAITQIALVVVASSAFFYLLTSQSPTYGSMLAAVATAALKLIALDPGAETAYVSGDILGHAKGVACTVPFNLDYCNVAVLAGLVLPLQRKGDMKTLGLTLFTVVSALLLNAILMASSVYQMAVHGKKAFDAYMTIQHGLLLAVPFVLWWIVTSGAKEGNKADIPVRR